MKIIPYLILLLVSVCSCREQIVIQGPDENGPVNDEEKEIIGSTIICEQADPLEKVLPDQKDFPDCPLTMEVARGETASFMFVLRSSWELTDIMVEAGPMSDGKYNINPGLTAFVGYTGVDPGSFSPVPSKDKILSNTGYYPDPLLELDSFDAKPSENLPIWISYDIPVDAPAGNYDADISISGKKNGQDFIIRRQVKAKVYPVTVPEQTLLVYQWINGHLNYLNNNETPSGNRYWDLLGLIVRQAQTHGQNVYMVQPINDCRFSQDGTGYATPSTRYTFDFTDFDKRVEIMLEDGKAERIVGQHIAYRTGGWYDEFGIQVPFASSTVIPFDATAKNFLDQFMPALYNHLKQKGWDKIYWQHIGDEPGTGESAESYNEIARYVKGLVPEIRILEANHSTKEVCSTIDVIAPLLDRLDMDWNYYRSLKDTGKELWFYTCMEPVGNYANRFLELPLIETRILHWINFKYGISGYMHWGLDSWRTLDWMHEAIDWGGTPAGDSWIIYPAYNKVYSSIRFEAMRDGIRDYELLKLLESKNPQAASEIVDGVIMDFDSYDIRIQAFRERKSRMLKLLSE